MNKKVIYTVITGGYDTLKNQPKQDGFDFICFTDNKDLKSDCWEIRQIPEELNNLSNVKKQRCLKILAHKYLPEYDFSVYIDGNVNILGNISDFIKNNCKEEDGYFFIGKHPERDCVYDEVNACIKYRKDKPETMKEQVEGYRQEGFPKHYGLAQSCIMFRYHNNPECIKLMEYWWNELKIKSHRDQLSLFYSKWKTNTKINLIDKSIFSGKYFRWNISHR